MMAAGFALGVVLTAPVAGWVGVLWAQDHEPPPDVHIHVVRDPDSGQLTSDLTELTRSEAWRN